MPLPDSRSNCVLLTSWEFAMAMVLLEPPPRSSCCVRKVSLDSYRESLRYCNGDVPQALGNDSFLWHIITKDAIDASGRMHPKHLADMITGIREVLVRLVRLGKDTQGCSRGGKPGGRSALSTWAEKPLSLTKAEVSGNTEGADGQVNLVSPGPIMVQYHEKIS